MNPPRPLKSIFCLALLLVVALLLLAGCAPSPEQIAAQTATAQTALAALWTPTSTATRPPTLTPSPTSAPSATPTLVPSQTPTPLPTSTAAPTASPTALPAARSSFTLKELKFSFAVPEGWKKTSDPNRLIFAGPTAAGTQMVLTFSLDQYSLMGTPIAADDFGLSMFSAHVQDTITGMVQKLVQVSEDFPDPAAGISYFRWVIESTNSGKEMHQAFYIFGSGKWFMTVMYGRAKSGGAENDALIDEALKTLTFE